MDSRIEQLLSAIVNGDTSNIKPQSRIEESLLAILEGRVVEAIPQSRIEAYLKALSEKGFGGSAPSESDIYKLMEVEY